MRVLLVLALLCLTLTLNATTYYVDPNGSDSNNGSQGSPWKTLAYAVSRVTAAGDIIHVNSGTFNETGQMFLSTGVSIEGSGTGSVIVSKVTSSGSFLLMLHSTSENTNGNQHISNITFDGGSVTAYGGVSVYNRGNVKVYGCTFRDFMATGIQFNDGGSVPVTRATGNEFYSNTVTNCSMYTSIGYGGLRIGGQQGMLVHDNNLSQTGRASGTNGYVIKYGGEGWNQGLKIYNNTITKEAYDGSSFDFAIELTHEQGTEIFNNTIIGAIDVNFVSKGSYNYGFYVHNNIIGPTASKSRMENGVILEFDIEGAVIKNNYFRNLGSIVLFSTRAGYDLKNNTFADNICDNIGVVGSTAGQCIRFIVVDSPSTSSDGFYVYNNVIIGRAASNISWGVSIPSNEGSTNNVVRNNIIMNFASGAITSNPGSSVNGLTITNNILYNNGNGNNPFYANGTPSNYTFSGNLNVNPQFVSSTDFHLQAGSPAIGAGVNVNLGTDYDGKNWNTNPSIGAFEYGSVTVTPPAVPVFQNAVTDNTTPSVVSMTYDLSLASVVPSASAFSVLVNSVSRTVNTVSVSGSKVVLTLASPVAYGDNISVAYSKPSSNPVQTTAGGQAASLSASSVTNNVAAISPVYVSSSVENASPVTLNVNYSLSLATVVPAASSFSVVVNSTARSVSSVSVSGAKVTLTLASRVFAGDAVTVSYTKPSSSWLQSGTGAIVAGMTNKSVVNNCINSAPVATITSPSVNTTFNAPATVSITATASDADGSVSSVEFYNGSTKLGSVNSAPFVFNWTNVSAGNYTLTAVAVDNLNSRTVSSGISISVNAIKQVVNRHPYIKISKPQKGSQYAQLSSVNIDAIASDPDGLITKVEFFSGVEKIGEMSDAPYSFTWKDVKSGTYIITAIATDNMNDTTKSSPVEFVVGQKIKYDANNEIVNLYPNPNNGHFKIELTDALKSEQSEIIITDLSGKQVYHGPIQREELTKEFDLSESRNGMYVMMIKDKDIYVTKKFMKN